MTAKPPPDSSWLRTPEVHEGDRRREMAEAKARFLAEVQSGKPPMVLSSGEGWVRRSSPGSGHECAPPMHEVTYRLPSGLLKPGVPDGTATCTEVDGALGDLWRCDCRKLWRVGDACDLCDIGRDYHGGLCTVGRRWRPATWWQRLRYRGSP